MLEKTAYQQLAEQIGAPNSTLLPRIFEALADDREAEFLLAAAPPATVEQIAEKTGLAATEIEAMVDPLFRKGLIFKSRKPQGTRYYRVRHVLQFHDATAVADGASREMLDLWKEFMASEWQAYAKQVDGLLPQAPVRVIPVNVSVEPEAKVLAFEDVKTILDNARSLAVTVCSCRAIDGACGTPLDVCVQMDRAADYSIERGTGRPLTRDEALRIMEDCEAEGLVHVTENRQSLGQVICNCCKDCCINWAPIRGRSGKFVAPSRFRAVVDTEECDGCELCLDRCFFDALASGNGEGAVIINGGNCMGCGVCQVVCPVDAIRLEEARPEEFVPA